MKTDRVLLSLACIFAGGCGLFSTKPALPRQADRSAPIELADQWTLAVQQADIIYFPVEGLSAAPANQSAAKMVRALRANGTAFSIAWLGIECEEGTGGEPRWSYSGRLRDQCKVVIREAMDVRQLPLGLPAPVRAKLQSGLALDDNDKGTLPRGYRMPSGGLEDFAEQLAAVRGLKERDVENLYRTHLATEQFAAEKIISFTRENKGGKLLVFARRQDLGGAFGLPAFVAQKVRVKQLTFDSDRSHAVRSRLVSLSLSSRRLVGF